MNKNQIITLSGFGTFDEDTPMKLSLARMAKKYKVKFYPTYYDHELKGKRGIIEKITKELWDMPRDQWPDNLLAETEVICPWHVKGCNNPSYQHRHN